jgi:hypothetical protein
MLDDVGAEFLTWKVIKSINSTVILAAISHSVMSLFTGLFSCYQNCCGTFHGKFWDNLTVNFPLQLQIQKLFLFELRSLKAISAERKKKAMYKF